MWLINMLVVTLISIYESLGLLIDMPLSAFTRPEMSLSPRFVKGTEVCCMTGPFLVELPTTECGESVMMYQ